MPSVIDSFVLELGFDAKNLASGQREISRTLDRTKSDAKKAGDEVESQAKRATEFAGKLRNQIIALYAVFTAGRGIKGFVTDITAADSALGRLAFRIDANAGTLAAWRGAGAMVGATAQDIYGTFQNLTTQLQMFAITGQSSVIPYLRAMGIQLKYNKDGVADLNDLFMQEAQWAATQSNKARAATILQQAGDSEGMVNLILAGPEAVRQYLAIAAKYAASPADIAAAAKMTMEFAEMEGASSKLGRTLRTQLVPVFETISTWLVSAAEWLEANPDVLDGIAAGLTAIGIALTVGLGAAAFSAAAAGFTAMGLAMGPVILAIAAIIYAGHELMAHWNEIKNWWHDLWGQMRNDMDMPSPAERAHRQGKAALQTAITTGLGMIVPGLVPYALEGLDMLMPDKGATAGTGVPVVGQRLLGRISSGESGGAYNVMYGGSKFSSYADHPNIPHRIMSGPHAGENSTAAGRYQFTYSTWKRAQAVLGLKDFSPANQDRAAWWLAQQDYQSKTGRNLLSDLNSGDPGILAGIGQALSSTWTSLSAGSFAGFGAGTAAISNSSSSHHSSRTIHIGQVTVNTQAKDANGIARDIIGALERGAFAVQADYGAA